MSEDFVICTTCNEQYRIGQWPWCPHVTGVGGYDPFTPVTDEHIADDPITFGNRGERSRYMDRNAIVPKDVSRFKSGKTVYFI
jgi:hypothetical protein